MENEITEKNSLYDQYGGSKPLITDSSFVSDYNSENFVLETMQDCVDSETDRKRNNDGEGSGVKKQLFPSASPRALKRNYSCGTNNTHNTNQSVSVYDSVYDTQFKNEDYNSNAYEALKNIENNSSNINLNCVNVQSDNQAARRRYEYDSHILADS